MSEEQETQQDIPDRTRSSGRSFQPATQEQGESGNELQNQTQNSTSSATDSERPAQERPDGNLFDRFMDNIMGQRRGENSDRPDNNNGAIVVTVNYVFSDENNPRSPNRLGSLIMTLPNNESNRDPMVIQDFIRLATQMAYTSIINGLHKERGIGLEKFNSFPMKEINDLEVTQCPICFEQFDALTDEDRECHGFLNAEEKTSLKRVKLNDKSAANSTSENKSGDNKDKDLSSVKDQFKHFAIEMPCGHTFGKSCLCEWLKAHNTCPLCRRTVAEPKEAPANEPFFFGIRDGNRLSSVDPFANNGQPNVTSGVVNSDPLSENPFPAGNSNETSLNDTNTARNEATTNSNPSPARAGRELPDMLFQMSPQSEEQIDSNFFNMILTNRRRRREEEQSSQGLFSNLFAYLRRHTPNADRNVIFPTGVSSRRTRDGVQTRSTDGVDDVNFSDSFEASSEANEERTDES